MGEVLVVYPGFGSVWLADAYYEGDFVVGNVGEGQDEMLMNFPKSCIRKVVGTVETLEGERVT